MNDSRALLPIAAYVAVCLAWWYGVAVPEAIAPWVVGAIFIAFNAAFGWVLGRWSAVGLSVFPIVAAILSGAEGFENTSAVEFASLGTVIAAVGLAAGVVVRQLCSRQP